MGGVRDLLQHRWQESQHAYEGKDGTISASPLEASAPLEDLHA